MENYKIACVIVTYNRLPLLKEVIDSLRNQTYKDYKIIVINNGSTDNTELWLKEQRDLITITQENLGGAGGFHTGMKYVAEHGFQYCWIMDDDVICQPSALEELIKAITVRENIGFVCSRVLGIDGRPMNTPTVDDRSKNGYSDYADLIDYFMIKVKAATFVSVLFSTEIIRKKGLPYKEYFIWGDDTEYTERISSVYSCYMACKSIVVHKRVIQEGLSIEKETNPQRLKFYFYKFRNSGHRFFMQGGSKKKYVWNTLLKAVRYLVKGQFVPAKITILSLLALYKFHPQIDYPNMTEKKVLKDKV